MTALQELPTARTSTRSRPSPHHLPATLRLRGEEDNHFAEITSPTMRVIPTGLQAHLDTGATTLAWCWRITRRDGSQIGFTDHDRDLDFDSTTFEAASGFDQTEVRETVGLSVDNADVEGALRSDKLNAADLEAGLYDNAGIEIWRVNWADANERVLIRSGSIGEVKRGPLAFSAEVRGLAHILQQEQGRTFQYACDALVGDGRCGKNLNVAAYRGIGAITEIINDRRIQGFGNRRFHERLVCARQAHLDIGRQ